MATANVAIRQGDCRDVLPTLETSSVQCCCTSPPYWGLRDYGTASWEGGEAGCDHLNGPLASSKSTLMGYTGPDVKLAVGGMPFRDNCHKCGARRIDSQLGLESTPQEYVTNMVAVFREVKRVLRDDGTLWLNLGDSYCATTRGSGGHSSKQDSNHGSRFDDRKWKIPEALKPKDLCGIPWRVAFALQADGWYLRSDIIWNKPNPMPESVTDRPTKAHEYLFLLTKQERYFYDVDAIREPLTTSSIERSYVYSDPEYLGSKMAVSPIDVRANSTWHGKRYIPEARNKRSVWTIPTQAFSEAHFATFPEDLVKPCILAGSRPGDTVLDPFAGSGTVGKVALELGRSALLIELSPDYCELARDRTNVTPGFVESPEVVQPPSPIFVQEEFPWTLAA